MSAQTPNASETTMVDSIRRRYIQGFLHTAQQQEKQKQQQQQQQEQQEDTASLPQGTRGTGLSSLPSRSPPPGPHHAELRTSEDDMTMCFAMDDNAGEPDHSTPQRKEVHPDVVHGAAMASAPTDFSAASSAQRTSAVSFGFVPPHIVAEQHDF